MRSLLVLVGLVALATCTDIIVVKLHASAGDPAEFGRAHGLVYVRSLTKTIGAGYHVYSGLRTAAKKGVHAMLAAHEGVAWSAPQHKRRQYTRTSDPLFQSQWHLHDRAQGLNIDGALAQNVDGTGVTIAIVDDGVEVHHPDLRRNVDLARSHDFNGGHKTDPSPWDGDSHGTSAAGCCCAGRNNNVCGVGTASGATLVGYRLIAAATSDLDEADGMSLHRDTVDVYSCSWGPPDDAQRLDGPGRLLLAALDAGVRHGRNGRGSIFVWAGGNGAQHNDNCNYDGYANDFRTISVSAYDDAGNSAYYSERCAMHFVAAPSSGAYTRGITTVSTRGQCTTGFGGTSAAAPQIAGVVANILQVNPSLGWRDVQGVLAKSAVMVNTGYDDWSANLRGYHHSHSFGFGRIDMPTTLDVARSWQSFPSMTVCSTGRVRVNLPIPDGSSGYGNLVIPIDTAPIGRCTDKINFIESIGFRVYLKHPRRGHVSITLVDPHGTQSRLALTHPDNTPDYPADGWLFGSVRHWGERPTGTWKAYVGDSDAYGGMGTFVWYELIIRGHKE